MIPRHVRATGFTIGAMVFLSGLTVGHSGCTQPTDRAAVNGKVTLDGEPIDVGSIVFTPIPPNSGPNAGGTIIDGEYDIGFERGVVPGLNRIEIRSSVKTGKQFRRPDTGTMMDEVVDQIPLIYNNQSTLEEEIAVGENTIDFELKSENPN